MERGSKASVQVLEAPIRNEIELKHDSILVVDPYALNIIDRGPRKGEVRLSFYSAFVIHTARELIESGTLGENGKVVLFGDASFGQEYPSTGDLMKEYLTRERPGGPILSEDRIVHFNEPDMNQTSTQVKKLAEYIKEKGMEGLSVNYLGFEYHRKRVKNHLKGFGINASYISAEIAHFHQEPKFDLIKLRNILPNEEIEKMEKSRRGISYIDKKGIVPRLAKPILGGSYMLDNYRKEDGTLGFEYKPGKQKLKELGLI